MSDAGWGRVVWGLVALFALASTPAGAQTIRPRPQLMACSVATAELGQANTWFGVFAGRRQNVFDAIQTISVQGCFRSERECIDWLYWMQSEWPDWTYRIGCAKGEVPNGNPVWWSQKRMGG